MRFFFRRVSALAALLLLLLALWLAPRDARSATPWGRDYFPNVPLVDHDGREVRFFDDLIEGKVVAINFIYTGCPDTCPLETAQLVRVQELLGDRLGQDVHFYSITLDPDRDTPKVLKEYREKFGARWTFLTGDLEDIWLLQKKLGLFLEEIRDGLNNHNVNMIIGNQKTGRWMKRSPHENPYVLADQIGTWLDGWKRPSELNTYGEAPELRDVSRGEQLFRTRCAVCHTMQGRDPERALGPDLLGVTLRRERQWLLEWLRAPDEMLARKDPIAMALFEQYNRLPMPNLRLNRQEALDVLQHIAEETDRLAPVAFKNTDADEAGNRQPLPEEELLVVDRAEIQAAHTAAKAQTGYLTLRNPGDRPVVLAGVISEAFGEIQIHELRRLEGRMRRHEVETLVIAPGRRIEMRPGSMQLICRERREAIPAGQKIPLTLQFERGLQQTTVAEVVRR